MAGSKAERASREPTKTARAKSVPSIHLAPVQARWDLRIERFFDRLPGVKDGFVEFRRALLAQRRRLLARVAQHEGDLCWLDENLEPEMVEEGQQQTLARLLARLDEHERAEITAIDRALERISHGEYGICKACRGPIPVARQRAMLTADTCQPCAAMREALEST